MSLDVFGRKLDGKSDLTLPRGLPGTEYKLIDEENNDVEYKTLCNIGKPKNPSVAGNLNAVQSLIEQKFKELTNRSTELIQKFFEQI